MPLQRQLKAQSPALAQSTQNFSRQFVTDLRDWVASRTVQSDELTTTVQLNLVLAANSTAYQTWRADESFDDLLRRLRRCFRQASPATAP